MRITVIMASYLGYYENCASSRDEKFIRAVKSFLDQLHNDKELIIIADGCEKTAELFDTLKERFKWAPGLVNLISIPAGGQRFSGLPRQLGIINATGSIISYLDTDDVLFGNHLAQISAGMGDKEWVYYNDFIARDKDLFKKKERETLLQFGRIGTSCIAHRANLPVTWPSDYGHDYEFITTLIDSFPDFHKIKAEGYLVCHLPGGIDY